MCGNALPSLQHQTARMIYIMLSDMQLLPPAPRYPPPTKDIIHPSLFSLSNLEIMPKEYRQGVR
jgi:hypothetical protein